MSSDLPGGPVGVAGGTSAPAAVTGRGAAVVQGAPQASGPSGALDSNPIRLRVTGLRVELGAKGSDVVDDVTFDVRAGEILGLVGESGSGKTTLAHALLGHARRGLSIANGSVELDGRDVLSMSGSELASTRGATIAYVPQDPSSALNPTLRIGPQLGEMLKIHPAPDVDATERVRQVLADVRLESTPDLLRRFPHQLSGGQQQRVALAMAFVCHPKLIVLDEPTTGLDVTTQRHVLETIRTLCQSYGVGAVYVSHDLAVVGELVHQVAVMYAGRIVELGETVSVFARPAHPYTARLLRAIPSVEKAEVLEGISGQPPRPGRRPLGCSFAPRCALAVDECRMGPPPVVDVRPPGIASPHFARCVRATEEVLPRTSLDTEGGRAPSLSADDGGHQPDSLVAEGVSARYGRVEVLRGVSFEVRPSTCLAVVGESGSGKTTLARCLVGMHANWDGVMSFGDVRLAASVGRRDAQTQRNIQYIFQNPYTSLNPRKTIGQLVAQPLRHFEQRLRSTEVTDRVVRALEDVSLSAEFLGRYPDQLSGGERQRVAIARALVVEPSLLVCDEVTSALDVSVQAVIVELLRRLQRERRLTMVFITHNLALVRSIGQSVLVLSGGRVVERGSVTDVLERPQDPYTIRLMEDVPKLGDGRDGSTKEIANPIEQDQQVRPS